VVLTEDDVKRIGVEILRSVTDKNPYTSLHDDAGYVKIGDRYLLLKIDGYDLKSALYPWCSLEDFGFRAVTSSVSDVIAKGAKPSYYAFSLGLSSSLTLSDTSKILKGIAEAIELYGGVLLNADTNIADTTWIDVTIVGFSEVPPIPRRGAKPGDRVLVPLVGDPFICYYSLYVEKHSTCPSRVAIDKCCRPRVPLRLSTILETFRDCVVASMDISDTFSETLYEIAALNNATIVIEIDALELLTPTAANYSEEKGIDPISVLSGTYEEYLPVIIVKRSCAEDLLTALNSLGLTYIDAGYIAKGPPAVTLKNGRELPLIKWSSTEASLHST